MRVCVWDVCIYGGGGGGGVKERVGRGGCSISRCDTDVPLE